MSLPDLDDIHYFYHEKGLERLSGFEENLDELEKLYPETIQAYKELKRAERNLAWAIQDEMEKEQ